MITKNNAIFNIEHNNIELQVKIDYKTKYISIIENNKLKEFKFSSNDIRVKEVWLNVFECLKIATEFAVKELEGVEK